MKRITTLILTALMAIPGFAQKDIQNKLDTYFKSYRATGPSAES